MLGVGVPGCRDAGCRDAGCWDAGCWDAGCLDDRIACVLIFAIDFCHCH